MDERIDTQMVLARAGALMKEIRKSEAYPALIGGIAGGIAGALMAALIAGRRPPPPPLSTTGEGRGGGGGGWSPREIVQLLAIGASLAKQVQAWYKERAKK